MRIQLGPSSLWTNYRLTLECHVGSLSPLDTFAYKYFIFLIHLYVSCLSICLSLLSDIHQYKLICSYKLFPLAYSTIFIFKKSFFIFQFLNSSVNAFDVLFIPTEGPPSFVYFLSNSFQLPPSCKQRRYPTSFFFSTIFCLCSFLNPSMLAWKHLTCLQFFTAVGLGAP